MGHIQYDAYLTSAVLNLGSTKGSLRRGAQETVSLDLPWLVCLLRALTTPLGDEDFVAPRGTTSRRQFDKLAKDAGLESCAFKPYSLRRGGATELWRKTANLQRVTLRGRWGQDRTTRIYIQDGAAQITTMRIERHRDTMRLANRLCERLNVPMSVF